MQEKGGGSLGDDKLLSQVPEVNGYKVLAPAVLYRVLGGGGFGKVYKGRHSQLEIDVAVKCLFPTHSDHSEEIVTRFKYEAHSAARINHPNVVRVYCVDQEGDLHYLVMEFVDGETVRERVHRKGLLNVEEAVQIGLGAARGLAGAHETGLIHRDIKPDNILISKKGEVKLADLGLSKPAGGEGMTAPNTVMGTPSYMPPEQCRDSKSVGPESDVYSLGATLYFLLTGKSGVDPSGTPLDVLRRVMDEPFPRVCDQRPEVPEALSELVARCTSKDRDERPKDGAELVRLLIPFSSQSDNILPDESAGEFDQAETLVSPPPSDTLRQVSLSIGMGRGLGSAGKSVAEEGVPAEASQREPQPSAAGDSLRASGAGGGSQRGSKMPLLVGALVLVAVAAFLAWYLSQGRPSPAESSAKLDPLPKEAALPLSGTAVPMLALDEPRITGEVQYVKAKELRLRGRIENAIGGLQVTGFGASETYSVTSEGRFDVIWPLEREGESVLTLSSEGLEEPVQLRLVVDQHAPVLTILTPDTNSRLLDQRSVDILVEATDDHLARVSLGARALRQDAKGRWAALDTPLSEEGLNAFELIGIDLAGNEVIVPLEVVRDTQPPILTLVSPAADARGTTRANFDLELKVAEPNPGEVHIDGSPMLESSPGRYVSKGIALPLQGDNRFVLSAEDRLGHRATLDLLIQRDSLGPVVVSVLPDPSSPLTTGSTLELVIQFDEAPALVTLDRRELTLDGRVARITLKLPEVQGAWNPSLEARDALGNPSSTKLDYELRPAIPTRVARSENVNFLGMSAAELKRYSVRLETNRGALVLELLPDLAPNHVRNFLALCHSGFYDDTLFYRVVAGQLIQGGCKNTRDEDWQTWGDAVGPRSQEPELNSTILDRGVLGMFPDVSEQTSSHFFIAAGRLASWQGLMTAFGRLISGEAALDAIASAPRGGDGKYDWIPTEAQRIRQAEVWRLP